MRPPTGAVDEAAAPLRLAVGDGTMATPEGDGAAERYASVAN